MTNPEDENPAPARPSAPWEQEHQRQQQVGLAAAYRNRFWMLLGLVTIVAISVDAFVRPHGKEVYGLVPLMVPLAVFLLVVLKKGMSPQARAAAHSNVDRTPEILEAKRPLRKMRPALIPIFGGMTIATFVPRSSAPLRALRTGGFMLASATACLVLLAAIIVTFRQAAKGPEGPHAAKPNQDQ